MSMTKPYLQYFVHVNKILGKYFLTLRKEIFVDVDESFATCPWMNDLYG
jgi:hypothetical protein